MKEQIKIELGNKMNEEHNFVTIVDTSFLYRTIVTL